MADLTGALCASQRYQNSSTHNWVPELNEFIEEQNARRVCQKCPVKLECAQQALDNREAWGVWGGMEEFRMRRALGVDSTGDPRIYNRELRCPFCDSTDLTIAKKRQSQGYPVECNYCSIRWNSYRIPDKIRKTLKRQHDSQLARSMGDTRNQGKP